MRILVVALLASAAACRAGVTAAGRQQADPAQLAAFARLPAAMPATDDPSTPQKVALGRMLYYDTRLSIDYTVSCNSCHPLANYGVDQRPTSPGVKGQLGSRNSPTVFNAAGHVAQFWDGRASTVEEQAKGPILNPVEMGMPNSDAVVQRLKAVPHYRAAFAAAFPGTAEPITYDNVARAIGAFERGLVTPSRWDAFLGGDATALTPAERHGLATFVAANCTACHRGAYLGGDMFQPAGVVEPWPAQNDSGRYAVTQQRGDRFVFKVPSLRNIERTAPYFHDGQVATLDEAVRWMARHQVGRELRDAEVTAIVQWLGALTGTIPQDYIGSAHQHGRGGGRGCGMPARPD
jgi:cytochrome c peroxidase